jgi:alkanesulfonate monooxygenase SsuD/methylene tetrahydromethanopterin reductase-like flavin-dependent oxidoreductase (luciferase family)
VLAAYAVTTNRIRLGTGVLPIFSRTPVSTAQTAATIDELSGGRMVIGLGVSHQVTVENWFDSKITKPVTQMREYAGIVRAILQGGEPPAGEHFKTKFRFMGYEARDDLPIYIGALSPNMLRLAGEIADGAMLWLCNPNYIRDVVVPEVAKGREKAGKPMDDFDIVAAVPSGVADDREEAFGRMRQELLAYFSLPFYRAMIERSGYEADIKAFDEAMAAGDVEKAKAAISDDYLENLTAIGSPDQVRDGVERYRDAGATSPGVGGIPGTDFEATLGAAAELL